MAYFAERVNSLPNISFDLNDVQLTEATSYSPSFPSGYPKTAASQLILNVSRCLALMSKIQYWPI